MNKQEILSSIFPSGDTPHVAQDFGGGYEVTGLPKGTVPQNCEVLASSQEKRFLSPGERRAHYLVRAGGATLYFRICTAMPGSGYDEFVAGLGFATDEEEVKQLESRARQAIEYLCQQ